MNYSYRHKQRLFAHILSQHSPVIFYSSKTISTNLLVHTQIIRLMSELSYSPSSTHTQTHTLHHICMGLHTCDTCQKPIQSTFWLLINAISLDLPIFFSTPTSLLYIGIRYFRTECAVLSKWRKRTRAKQKYFASKCTKSANNATERSVVVFIYGFTEHIISF